jgi:hypothetical protein
VALFSGRSVWRKSRLALKPRTLITADSIRARRADLPHALRTVWPEKSHLNPVPVAHLLFRNGSPSHN